MKFNILFMHYFFLIMHLFNPVLAMDAPPGNDDGNINELVLAHDCLLLDDIWAYILSFVASDIDIFCDDDFQSAEALVQSLDDKVKRRTTVWPAVYTCKLFHNFLAPKITIIPLVQKTLQARSITLCDFVDITDTGDDALTALHWAARENKPEVAKILLCAAGHKKQTLLMQQSKKTKWTALCHAAHHGNIVVAKLLLNAAEEKVIKLLMKTDCIGWKALEIASCNGKAELVKLLQKVQDALENEDQETLQALLKIEMGR